MRVGYSKVEKKVLWKTILNLKLYLIRKQPKNIIRFTNYFLLGFREKYYVLNATSISDNLDRLYLFLKLCRRAKFRFWIMGSGRREFGITWWLNQVTGCAFIHTFARRGSLIYYRGRFFWFHHRFMSHYMARFLGFDAAIAPYAKLVESMLWTTKSYGIPTIGVDSALNNPNLLYALNIDSEKNWQRMFYLRLLAYFIAS